MRSSFVRLLSTVLVVIVTLAGCGEEEGCVLLQKWDVGLIQVFGPGTSRPTRLTVLPNNCEGHDLKMTQASFHVRQAEKLHDPDAETALHRGPQDLEMQVLGEDRLMTLVDETPDEEGGFLGVTRRYSFARDPEPLLDGKEYNFNVNITWRLNAPEGKYRVLLDSMNNEMLIPEEQKLPLMPFGSSSNAPMVVFEKP